MIKIKALRISGSASVGFLYILTCVLILILISPEPAKAEMFGWSGSTIGPKPQLEWPPDVRRPVVVIRYIGFVEEPTYSAFKNRYLFGWYVNQGKAIHGNSFIPEPNEDAPAEMVVNTAYYAAELRRYLESEIPSAYVLLDPQAITVRPDGVLAWSVAETDKPADVVIDFTAYVNPQWYGADVGDFDPLFSIKVSQVASPQTHGLVAESKYIKGLGTVGDDQESPFASLGGTLIDLLNDSKDNPDDKNFVLGNSASASSRPWTGEKAILLKHIVPKPKVDQANGGKYTLPDSKAVFAYLTIDALNQVQRKFGKIHVPAAYIKTFDQSFAAQLSTSDFSAVPSGVKKASAIEHCFAAEAKFLDAKSDALSAATIDGDFGNSFQEMQAMQLHQAKKGMLLGFLTLGAAAGSVSKGGAANGSIAQSTSPFVQMMQQSTTTFRALANPITSLQEKVIVEMGGDSETVESATLQELRNKLRSIYSKAFLASAPQ